MIHSGLDYEWESDGYERVDFSQYGRDGYATFYKLIFDVTLSGYLYDYYYCLIFGQYFYLLNTVKIKDTQTSASYFYVRLSAHALRRVVSTTFYTS